MVLQQIKFAPRPYSVVCRSAEGQVQFVKRKTYEKHFLKDQAMLKKMAEKMVEKRRFLENRQKQLRQTLESDEPLQSEENYNLEVAKIAL